MVLSPTKGLVWLGILSNILLNGWFTYAWLPTSSISNTRELSGIRSNTRLYEKGPFSFLSPYESKIPEELRDEIYAAEANTPAAKERGQRVALYAVIALIGIGLAFFNGFLTELRTNGPDGSGSGVDLTEAGFGWVVDNFLFTFFLTNKIGGGICLLGGAGAGLLAEAELDTKRINAEKIYEELERRRAAKMKKTGGGTQSKQVSSRKKRRSGKEKKRLSALSEVVAEEETPEVVEESPEEAVQEEPEPKTEEPKKGIFGSVKDLYDKADTMAASQALLLNKKLEEAGVVDKITDESGLKVIGREEAAKLEDSKKETAKDD